LVLIGSYRVYIYRLDIKKWHTFWNFLNFPYFSYVMTYEVRTLVQQSFSCIIVSPSLRIKEIIQMIEKLLPSFHTVQCEEQKRETQERDTRERQN
jgi:hypothetical protein